MILSFEMPWITRKRTSRHPFGEISVGVRAPRPRGSAERSGLCSARAGLGRRAEGSELLAISASNGGGRAAASANNFDRKSKRRGRKIVPRESKQHIRLCSEPDSTV